MDKGTVCSVIFIIIVLCLHYAGIISDEPPKDFFSELFDEFFEALFKFIFEGEI